MPYRQSTPKQSSTAMIPKQFQEYPWEWKKHRHKIPLGVTQYHSPPQKFKWSCGSYIIVYNNINY